MILQKPFMFHSSDKFKRSGPHNDKFKNLDPPNPRNPSNSSSKPVSKHPLPSNGHTKAQGDSTDQNNLKPNNALTRERRQTMALLEAEWKDIKLPGVLVKNKLRQQDTFHQEEVYAKYKRTEKDKNGLKGKEKGGKMDEKSQRKGSKREKGGMGRAKKNDKETIEEVWNAGDDELEQTNWERNSSAVSPNETSKIPNVLRMNLDSSDKSKSLSNDSRGLRSSAKRTKSGKRKYSTVTKERTARMKRLNHDRFVARDDQGKKKKAPVNLAQHHREVAKLMSGTSDDFSVDNKSLISSYPRLYLEYLVCSSQQNAQLRKQDRSSPLTFGQVLQRHAKKMSLKLKLEAQEAREAELAAAIIANDQQTRENKRIKSTAHRKFVCSSTPHSTTPRAMFGTTPQPTHSTPKPLASTHLMTTPTPKPLTSTLQLSSGSPNRSMATPKGHSTTPKPLSSTPKPHSSTPGFPSHPKLTPIPPAGLSKHRLSSNAFPYDLSGSRQSVKDRLVKEGTPKNLDDSSSRKVPRASFQ